MQSKRLILLFLFVLTVSSAAADDQLPLREACDASYIAEWASDCVGVEEFRLPCCEMVLASVGIGFGEKGKVPCLCLVAREPAFLATGLDIHKVLEMYSPICHGSLPVDSHSGDSCQEVD